MSNAVGGGHDDRIQMGVLFKAHVGDLDQCSAGISTLTVAKNTDVPSKS